MIDRLWTKYEKLFSGLEEKIAPVLRRISSIELANQARVLSAFRELQVDETCFYGSTGYGYNDTGREKLDMLFAKVFGGEAGLVRPQFVSGTHAIACSLYAILEPGDRLVSLTGRPYDTLQKALGLLGGAFAGGLVSSGIKYAEVDLCDGCNEEQLERVLTDDIKVIFIQRSRGYSQRRSLTVDDVARLTRAVKKRLPEALVFVDNCYGEFTGREEPCHVGADLMAGSLIKNPGGGLANTGGYVVGRAELVEKVAWRLTAPGLGAGIGSMSSGVKRLLYQGLFMSPHLTAEALRGMTLAAALFAGLGYEVSPEWDEERGDTVQAVCLGTPELLLKFCRAVQSFSPVDSHLTPLPAPMVGYSDEIIMAAGTFVQGAGSEFSADAPLRPPFTVFMQGGLSYAHVRLALSAVVEALEQESLS